MPPKFQSIFTEFGGNNMDFMDNYPKTLPGKNRYLSVEPFIEVKVQDPQTQQAKFNKYTDYEVVTRTNFKMFKPVSSVRRRYSDFRRLLEFLNLRIPKVAGNLAMPPKKMTNRFDPDVIEERMAGLTQFLQYVVTHPMILSTATPTIRKFLQQENLPDYWEMDDS